MNESHALFYVGQLVQHRLFEYRGVIVDVDATYQGTDEWYEKMANTKPPKDAPWYRVLVDEADHATYVAEQNLSAETNLSAVSHPLVGTFFSSFENGIYTVAQRTN